MNMKLRFLTASALVMIGTGLLSAADPQLLNLVMPDAKILAGVNVDQAKTSPFGLYVVAQIQAQDKRLQEIETQTGFDPTRDLHELLLASTGTQPHGSGLTLARGTFKPEKIDAAAQSAGGVSESYKGVTIIEDSKRNTGFAFLNANIAIAGDVASVKGAIDRQTAPATLPAALLVKVNQLSTTEDAWGISEVPPPVIHPAANAPNTPNIPTTVFQNIQQATGGVKLGSQVVITAELQADRAQNATALANVLQFLLNLAEMHAQQNPQAGTVLKSTNIAANGNLVNVSLNVPEAEAEALFQLKQKAGTVQPHGILRQKK